MSVNRFLKKCFLGEMTFYLVACDLLLLFINRTIQLAWKYFIGSVETILFKLLLCGPLFLCKGQGEENRVDAENEVMFLCSFSVSYSAFLNLKYQDLSPDPWVNLYCFALFIEIKNTFNGNSLLSIYLLVLRWIFHVTFERFRLRFTFLIKSK